MRLYNKHYFFKIIILSAIFCIINNGCNSERRFQKAELKLKQNNTIRAWPYNYSFTEYSDRFDNAIRMIDYYKESSSEASKNNDERRVQVMNKNIKRYESTIKQLKGDHKFYSVYKIRQDKIKTERKEKEKITKEKEREQIKFNKANTKETKRQTKDMMRERKEILDNKRKRMKTNIAELKDKRKNNSKSASQKQKEITTLKKIAQKSGAENNPSIKEEIERLNNEFLQIKHNNESISKQIDSLNLVLEKFIDENYNKKDTVIESQMKLSKDNIPTKTKPINISDSIK